MREVLTYSRRGGRFTPSQQESWDAHHRDWVIPDEAVDDPAFRWADVFGREAPLIVEIGSGVGEATAALAAARPSYDVVALEVWRPGVAHTLGLLAEAGADNVRLLSVDAVWCLEHLFAPGEVEELWTFFPDPWPKTRHHKRRLVNAEFAALAASRLRAGGVWRLATDWADYADADARPCSTPSRRLDGGVVPRWEDRPVTKFERKGVAADRAITDLAYRRRDRTAQWSWTCQLRPARVRACSRRIRSASRSMPWWAARGGWCGRRGPGPSPPASGRRPRRCPGGEPSARPAVVTGPPGAGGAGPRRASRAEARRAARPASSSRCTRRPRDTQRVVDRGAVHAARRRSPRGPWRSRPLRGVRRRLCRPCPDARR